MNIIRLLRDESPKTLYFIAIMSSLSGLAGGAILATINYAASEEVANDPGSGGQYRLFFLFLVALVALVTTKRFSMLRATNAVEISLAKLRVEICDKLRRSDLETIEGLDKNEAFTTVARDTSTISQFIKFVANASQQVVLLVIGVLYLAYLSRMAFLLFLAIAAIAGYVYVLHSRELKATYQKDIEKQSELFAYLNHILYGFQELRLSRRKNDELFDDMREIAYETRDLAMRSGSIYAQTTLIADISYYVLLGTMVFVLPQISDTYSDVLLKSIVAVMFVFGPLSAVIAIVPQMSNAEVALDNLYAMESRLDEKLRENAESDQLLPDAFTEFSSIGCQAAVFSYRDRQGSPTFTIGPIDLQIKRGEILFIVGGNGSGKSTLLKVITGLYTPQAGTIKLDDQPIDFSNRATYREIFAGVFSNFHLFDRLYGVDQIGEQTASEMLEKMEIAHKVNITDGRFTTLDLSTGQRKRLALISSLLEDRQVYVFDEWTADQDPAFRQHFYYDILPELKANGKTVIAITHDDRYWNTADRVVKLEYGQIVSAENPDRSDA